MLKRVKEFPLHIGRRTVWVGRQRKFTGSGVERSIHVYRIGFWHWKLVYWEGK